MIAVVVVVVVVVGLELRRPNENDLANRIITKAVEL